MRVIVCGGRSYDEWRTVAHTLDTMDPTISVLIQGGAPGADRLAEKWANTRGVPVVTYPANWSRGKKAGPERNDFMLRDSRADLVVAFPGGRGTEDMIRRAEMAGVPVVSVRNCANRIEVADSRRQKPAVYLSLDGRSGRI